MNIESLIFEKIANPSPSNLELLAEKVQLKDIDVSKLDKPMGLTQETRSQLPELSKETKERLETKNWPDSILENIGSEAEAEIYENANIEPDQINGKDSLVKTDIDYSKEDDFGRTNLERMEAGLAPLDSEGKPIELHHIGQKQDSPLAELTRDEHRGKETGNDNVLHDKLKESEINRGDFDRERQEHWKSRAGQYYREDN